MAEMLRTPLPQTDLRPPDDVMRLERLGSFFPTRLSFMRVLIRRLAYEQAALKRPVWDMDDDGFGQAVYSIDYGGYTYSLIAYSNRLAPDQRTDRVIAEAWDAVFVLFDGVPNADDLERNRQNAPLQEAGRYSAKELVLSRANKSVRFFEHTVRALMEGAQPDTELVQNIGYLMRTTAVYGNGKFGIADRATIKDRPNMSGPFQAEMLTVWLIRQFSHDLVEHIARAKAPLTATGLKRNIRRHLGIGNSTGLGMAPFLVNHPILLNNWMIARETALARARAASVSDWSQVDRLVERSSRHLGEWSVDDPGQMAKIETLRGEWDALHNSDKWRTASQPWDALYYAATGFGAECQELTAALIIEANGSLVDGLSDCMDSDIAPLLDAGMTCGALQSLIETYGGWALEIDFDEPANTAQFWYVSEEKLEPRLGQRHLEAGAERESPLDIARQIKELHACLSQTPLPTTAELLMRHPEHRNAARRIQTLARFPYAEIRDNLIGNRCRPIDMLRAKLSLFGAAKFDPKSDRWTRINLYQGAPLADELNAQADDWWLPCFEP